MQSLFLKRVEFRIKRKEKLNYSSTKNVNEGNKNRENTIHLKEKNKRAMFVPYSDFTRLLSSSLNKQTHIEIGTNNHKVQCVKW